MSSYFDGLEVFSDPDIGRYMKLLWLLMFLSGTFLMCFQLQSTLADYLEEKTYTRVELQDARDAKFEDINICIPLYISILYRSTDSGNSSTLEPLPAKLLTALANTEGLAYSYGLSGLWLNVSLDDTRRIHWRDFQAIQPLHMPQTKEIYALNNILSLSNSSERFNGTSSLPTEGYSFLLVDTYITPEGVKERSKAYFCERVSVQQNVPGQFQYAYNTDFIRKSTPFDESYHDTKSAHLRRSFFVGRENVAAPSDKQIYSSQSAVSLSWDQVTLVKHVYANLARQKCEDTKGRMFSKGGSKAVCWHNCIRQHYIERFQCAFHKNLTTNEEDAPPCNLIHLLDIARNIAIAEACSLFTKRQQECTYGETFKAWNARVYKAYVHMILLNETVQSHCESICKQFLFCEEWELSIHYRSYQKTGEQQQVFWNGTFETVEPVISHSQTLTLSFTALIVQMGGLFNFYFGASVCGFLHIAFFFLSQLCA